jgi:hypothetical protein
MARFYELASGLVVLSIADVLWSEQSNLTVNEPEPPEPPPFDHLAPPGARAILHDGVGWHGDDWIGVPLDASIWEVPPLFGMSQDGDASS